MADKRNYIHVDLKLIVLFFFYIPRAGVDQFPVIRCPNLRLDPVMNLEM